MNPLISIIVPVYNNELYIKKCIDSIINQTYDNIEIILVDDGSTDKSGVICDEYEQNYNNVKVVHQNNMGVSHARNTGLKIVQGEYIGFVDSDDWIEPDMYEILYKDIVNSKAQISIVGFLFELKDGMKIKSCKNEIYLELSPCEAIKNMFIGALFAGQLCNKLFNAQLFKGLFLNEEIKIYEDMLLTWDLFFRSQTIVFHGVCKYHYNINSNSACNSEFNESYYTINTACEMLIEKIRLHFPEFIDYAKVSAINANICLVNKTFPSKSSKTKYIRLAVKNIRKNLTFGSLVKITSWQNKISALCLYTNVNIYRFWDLIILILRKIKRFIYKIVGI